MLPVVPVLGAGASTALNVPLMRVAVNVVMVTVPLLPATDELCADVIVEPLTVDVAMLRIGNAVDKANVPVPETSERLIESDRVLFVAVTPRVVPV